MKKPAAVEPLDDTQWMLRAEVERAIALFSNDECEAICEVMRRSHSIPLSSACFCYMGRS
jgi:hypothetical protein